MSTRATSPSPLARRAAPCRRVAGAGVNIGAGTHRVCPRIPAAGRYCGGVPGDDAATVAPDGPSGSLDGFSEPTRAWFSGAFAAPTPAQERTWGAAAAGGSILVAAPTGSGKTLAAFLVAIDRLAGAAVPGDDRRRTRVLYVSPLKALAYDVDRNLRAPLVGITRAAQHLGAPLPSIEVAMRTGDTPADERRRMGRHPPDILITTPESLFLLLTSQARETLAGVDTVIVDEVHAVAGSKRGAHLALSLERLEALRLAGDPAAQPLQRIGLSATQRPVEEVARFLVGGSAAVDGTWRQRPVEIVDVGATKTLDIEIVVPVEDMSRLGEVVDETASGPAAGAVQLRRSIWPAVHPKILELIKAHRSTIVFVNSRRLAERLCARLNELYAEEWEGDASSGDAPAPEIARAHHGSVAREQRVFIEEELKAGRLRCVVATSSLELGIDMGAVDLVVQVESPGSVATGLQRVGRAGHQVGSPSVGKVFPKYRGDLVEAAVVVRRMYDGDIETTAYPRNPLDVLAQQIVAMAAMDRWSVDQLWRTVRGAAGFADLSRAQLDGVLDMLSGRYPSDEFAELRPRLNWDRVDDAVTGRPSAQRLAVTSGGTIPDRGLYGVFIAGEGAGRRVGELDEEMVYETRPGETFTLGSSTWRVEDITRDQVLVTPAPGEQGKLPFWHGDAQGRPVELGRAVGGFLREVGDLADHEAVARLETTYGLDPLAASNLVAYLADQREATGVLPSDRTLVIERFRDEIGDWRVCILSPFGGRVHAPWALAIEARARERLAMEVQTIWADDGIVIRLPEADDAPPLDLVVVPSGEVEDLIVGELADSALFASRFRECASRALLLPKRRLGGRTPLWQQRQKSADLLQVAARYGSFPILLETYRECLRDVFDLAALVDVLRGIESRTVRISQVETATASPFASSLLFNYLAASMYEGDAPLAERRAQALSLDRELLAELLGSDELRELIDADALVALELELQRLIAQRHVRDLDGVHDLLRDVGDLRGDEITARVAADDETVIGW
ncbi:MAG: DEAD/DEAH box helicase, partial [Nitriliruptorales bacterium]|nr:DEAD/DEAH box helicase [Nitriliruptorales bacterium]